jgi:hypothetical protein
MFAYPKQAAFERVLPKNKIYEHARPTRAVQQRFVDQVTRIVWQYKLSPETTNLATRSDVPEIQIFSISIKVGELDENVLRCIDKAISFPIFYEVIFGNKIKEIAAFKRPSDADSSKWVVGDYFETVWQPMDSNREPLPISLDLAGLYEQMLRRLFPFPALKGESLKSQAERLGAIRSKENECCKLEARLTKEKQFNRKVELNTELRRIKNELEFLVG